MDCSETRNLLSEYRDGTLDPAAEEAMAAHLRGCGECAGWDGSLLAVRECLRNLPPEPAPPELVARVLAAVAAEDRGAGVRAVTGGAGTARPFLSRFRIPLEAAAVVLLFASVYWFQRTAPSPGPPPASPPSAPSAQAPGAAPPVGVSHGAAGGPVAVARLPRGTPPTKRGEAPAAAKPRAWTAADLPSAPALLASTDSERVVPVATSPGPSAAPGKAGIPAFPRRRYSETERGAEFRASDVLAAPPSRLLRPLPYGRDLVVDVDAGSREGAEDRIAGAAARLGGIVERIERGSAGAAPGVAGSVRVVLPAAAAARFLEEMERIGTIPPEGTPAATDLPGGPWPGTVAYAVRIRVR